MKIRRDPVAVSSILFTVALLMLTPAMWTDASFAWESSVGAISGSLDGVDIGSCYAPVGMASLAIIAIGLIVTWAGYFKGVRWTWFVMFVIVWVWAFPLFILQYVQHPPSATGLIPGLGSAIRERGPARDFVEVVLIFLLMLVALVLPAKTFLLGRGIHQTKPLAKP